MNLPRGDSLIFSILAASLGFVFPSAESLSAAVNYILHVDREKEERRRRRETKRKILVEGKTERKEEEENDGVDEKEQKKTGYVEQ